MIPQVWESLAYGTEQYRHRKVPLAQSALAHIRWISSRAALTLMETLAPKSYSFHKNGSHFALHIIGHDLPQAETSSYLGSRRASFWHRSEGCSALD